MESEPARSQLRFDSYRVDLRAGELRKNGIRVRIQEQPLRLLAFLAHHQGQLVTRADLQKELWPGGTFVDFEDGLNTAVRKLREALGDSAEKPRYIETVPRHGYRFVAKIEEDHTNGAAKDATIAAPVSIAASFPSSIVLPPSSHATTVTAPPPAPPVASYRSYSPAKVWLLTTIGVVLAAAAVAGWLLYGRPAFSFNPRDSVLVADFENQTGDPRFDQALETAFIVSLEQSLRANVFPRERIASALQLMGKPATQRITPTVGQEICQRESIRGLIVCSITRTGDEYALTGQLIDPQTGATVRSYSERSYGEDHILDALDVIANDIRKDLGESLYQIHRTDLPLPQVTTASLDALKQYADAQALWRKGKFDDAMTLFRGAIASDPNFAMAHAALANGYYSYIYNQQSLGEEEYRKALGLSAHTTERERLAIQANYASDLGHVDDADRLFRFYLGEYPDDWVMLTSYARLLRMHGRALEAIEQYKKIIHVAPDDARAYVEMATAYKALGNSPEALRSYSEAFQLNPVLLTSGNINREYGFTLVENGEDNKAEQVFTDLLAKPDTKESGLRSLAMLDLLHGRYASARQRTEEALAIDESRYEQFSMARVHFMLALIAEGEGEIQEQIRQLNVAADHLQKIGQTVAFGALVGQEYARAGEIDKAQQIADLIAPLADHSSNEDTGYIRVLDAEIDAAKGNTDEAVRILMVPRPNDSTSVRTVMTEALAHVYQQSGQTDQAILAYQNIVNSPTGFYSWEPQQRWVAAHYLLASDYLTRGEKQKANQAISTFLDLWKDADPNLPLLKKALDMRAEISQTESSAQHRASLSFARPN